MFCNYSSTLSICRLPARERMQTGHCEEERRISLVSSGIPGLPQLLMHLRNNMSLLMKGLIFLLVFTSCTPSPSDDREKIIPHNSPLVIQPAHMDMGEVVEGKEAKATLFLRNTGHLPVHVAKVESSCGCTAVSPDSRELLPGAFTLLRVRVDTTAKRGQVKKSITVFDSQGRKTQAWLTLKVRPNPHTGGMQGRGIFSGKCASCHFEPAEGKVTGVSIYNAVCAMCHGESGKGAYAPTLRGQDTISISSVLENGLGRKMPAFSKEQSGPLSRSQIAIVARWLSELDE